MKAASKAFLGALAKAREKGRNQPPNRPETPTRPKAVRKRRTQVEMPLDRAAAALGNADLPAWASWVAPAVEREAKRMRALEAEVERLRCRRAR